MGAKHSLSIDLYLVHMTVPVFIISMQVQEADLVFENSHELDAPTWLRNAASLC
jgi:hypothetical protein